MSLSSPNLFNPMTVDPSIMLMSSMAVQPFNQTALSTLNLKTVEFCSAVGTPLKMRPFSYNQGPLLTAVEQLLKNLSEIYNHSLALTTELFKMKMDVFEKKAQALCLQLNELAYNYRKRLQNNEYNRLYQLIDFSFIVNFFSRTFSYSTEVEKIDFALKMIADIHLIHSAPLKASDVASLISLKGKGEQIFDEAAQEMIEQCDYENGFKTIAKANAIRMANAPSKALFSETSNPENDPYLSKAFEETLAQNEVVLAHYARALMSSKIAQLECLSRLIDHALKHKDFLRIVQYAEHIVKILPNLKKQPFFKDVYSERAVRQIKTSQNGQNFAPQIAGISYGGSNFIQNLEQLNEYLSRNNKKELAKKLKISYS